MIDWPTVFEHATPNRGATEAEIAEFVATFGAPLTRAEVARVNGTQCNPWLPTDPQHATWEPFDSAAWVMPADRPIPPSYLSFIRYSDGGRFSNGMRLFQMAGTELRSFLIVYHVPQYMPLAVPFAFTDSGGMYLFDMREPPDTSGEYPIICAGAGALDFDPHESPRIASNFLEACCGRFNVERLQFGRVVLTADQWETCTDLKPMLDGREGYDRKLRLFACACARRVWHLMPGEHFWRAIETAEQFADGKVTDEACQGLKKKCESMNTQNGWSTAAAAATHCLSTDAVEAAWSGAQNAAGSESSTDRGEGPKWEAARAKQVDLLREIFGNPFRPIHVDPLWLKWNNGTVPQIADRIYQTNNFGDLLVLADALEEAGCTDAETLAHLRGQSEHVRGCWALDLLRTASA
ncbi:SMI1/KNR4 family protein OS=Paenibacillus alvei DSM 29 GN=PAV_9c00940 PE=4 SV=1 [Gemmata massiliana]|uniref:SMI1/KNR4 family protein n=1 Tax=Gemmata massiliana TaxID=1210884 RepID=A0A6P2CPZ2_9BACT|nr:SMI1/KNR4 family protein [Gemmata massiliana]VTR90909.1 SMI1/KNR4 family protein OS=Paenibacillus alvei DSM 29 GN=PAV_9c00940 PE=4 SV=1 [Gemmata massiliana]